jgi:NhaA family Na+:H+ antiporter
MSGHRPEISPAPTIAERFLGTIDRFLHVEAVSGVVLLVAAAAALIWANSPAAASYDSAWHSPLTLGIAGYVISQPLHFWINDVLMTVFFLVVGMEIRREVHQGSLEDIRLAALPLAAAVGGVLVPALLYLALNPELDLRRGWAVPTATDIAFAVGVLALVGRSVPSSMRVFLLAIAIIDDIVAVIIIALFYADGVTYGGFVIAGLAMLTVLGLQRAGIGSAYGYLIPGAVLWFGLFHAGIHPTLAGVILGLMTPVRSIVRKRPIDAAVREFERQREQNRDNPHALQQPLSELRYAQRELLPPVYRVQMALHPWVAYGVIPLFALANAGVSIGAVDVSGYGTRSVMLGALVGLIFGKPVGIFLGSWIAVRAGWCRLPPGLTWRGVWVVGCLGGIGFTMSIFIANLAFGDGSLLTAAKLGVLIASLVAGTTGLIIGKLSFRHSGAEPVVGGASMPRAQQR